ncbi:MAG: MOSC domain-containing protein [Halolamina sp.]
MARLERVRIYPVKGLDAVEVDAAETLDGGTLAGDREFALFDADAGDVDGSPHESGVFNAKHSDRFHELDTAYGPETATLTVDPTDGERRQFDLDAERDAAGAWFSAFFDHDLVLRRDASLGFVDRRGMGPSVISTATIETVASWFDGLSVENVRRRLRANVEVAGVPPFWEDRFVGDDAPAFTVGGVRFEGVTPCARCVVPERDPETGEATPEFRDRFVEMRRETFPDWADEGAFDHLYTLMLIAQVAEGDRSQELTVGDDVAVVD